MARKAPRSAFKKGSKKPPGSGRKPGQENKVTRDVRECIRLFAEQNVQKFTTWVTRTAKKNPAKAGDLFLRAIEYHIPKLNRTEHVGVDGDPILFATTMAAQVAAAPDVATALQLYQQVMRGEPAPRAETPATH